MYFSSFVKQGASDFGFDFCFLMESISRAKGVLGVRCFTVSLTRLQRAVAVSQIALTEYVVALRSYFYRIRKLKLDFIFSRHEIVLSVVRLDSWEASFEMR